jgi:hypothetical protein
MKIGVLFDIDDLGGGTYGQTAWAIVMTEFRPDNCGGTSFLHGDVDIKGNSRPYTFCIAIDSMEIMPIENFKKVLMQSNQKGILPTQHRFIDGTLCDHLPCAGLIDAQGRFLVEDHLQWLINVAWRNGWKSFPSLRWLGWFAGAYLIRTQPDYGTPWNDETVAAAKHALLEAGPNLTLTALKEHLDKTNEEGVKSICQKRIGVLKEIWATNEKGSRDIPPKGGFMKFLKDIFIGFKNEQTDKKSFLSDLAQNLLSDNREIRDNAINLTRKYALEGNQKGLDALKEAIIYMYEGKNEVKFRAPTHMLITDYAKSKNAYDTIMQLAKNKMLWKTPPDELQHLYSLAMIFSTGKDILNAILELGDRKQSLAFQLIGMHFIVQADLNKQRVCRKSRF